MQPACMHPMRKAVCDRIASNWLVAAQLKADSNCSVRTKDLSHHQKQALAPSSMPIKHCGLLLVDFYFLCCFMAMRLSWSVLSRAQAKAG